MKRMADRDLRRLRQAGMDRLACEFVQFELARAEGRYQSSRSASTVELRREGYQKAMRILYGPMDLLGFYNSRLKPCVSARALAGGQR